ncbi:hypothetical protein GCM10025782_26870 [Pedococcus ginsenosidimutans]|uniref:DUF4439 domain-containing protein n=1 Tax=Pedococcus ginsenosidimutans TaxID=490570 RepID=A0ABP8YFS3_9MICO
MTLDHDHTPSTPRRILLFLLACVLALVLPFMVMRELAPHQASSGDTGTDSNAAVLAARSSLGATARATSGTRTSTAGSASASRTTGATAAATAGAPGAPVATTAGTDPLAADAESCRLANLRQQAPLSAAAVSLAQFDKHIDAMNLLVAGKISLAVARTFWDQTRVGAAQNAAAFRSADRELASSASSCQPPDPAVAYETPYGQLLAISRCAGAIRSRGTALARARAAVSTWEHHIHDMEMLRMGHITPAQATAAWTRNWKVGAGQLAAYETADAAAKKLPCSLD